MPGPKKTPTLVLRQRGSWRAKTRRDVEVSGIPEIPRGMDYRGKRFWEETIPLLAEMGILASADWSKLELLCVLYSKMKEYQKKLESGEKCFERWIKLVDKFNKLCSEFCIGPTSRAGMGNIQKPNKDDKSKFFNKNA